MQLAETMAVAHGLPEPIVHRDLKPDNILVAQSDCFPPKMKIADFGLGGISISASVQSTKHSKGVHGCTIAYASSELLRNVRRTVPSDDVHALGVMWYELLSGEELGGRPSGTEWRQKLTERGMTVSQLDFLQRCFDGESRRPKNAREMADEINRLFPSLRQRFRTTSSKSPNEGERRELSRLHQRSRKTRIGVWKQAADQDLPEAQWLYGLCWEMGIEADPKLNKYEQAAYWFRKADDHGMPEAQYCLAVYHRYGLGGRKDDDRNRHRWLEKAAAGGQIDQLYELGSHWWQTAQERNRLASGDKEADEKLVDKKLRNEIVCLWVAAQETGHVEAQMSYSLRCLFDLRQSDWLEIHFHL